MATTAMPAFLAALGVGSAAFGLIEGLADSASSVAKLVSAFLPTGFADASRLAVIGK